MFRSARLKLTAWYLFIIMLVSVSFSVAIYTMLSREVERFSLSQRLRIERRLHLDEIIPPDLSVQPPVVIDPDLVNETKHRILFMLVFVNGTIFVLAGGLGYILAGQTLRPIADMLDEQNRFIQDSSHELRTPLTSLKSTMEVSLRDKNLTITDAKILIKESITEVNKLQSLSDSLLALAQYEKPNGYISFEKVSLMKIVEQATRNIHALAANKHITIIHSIKDFSIKGNSDSLIEMLVILLDNAVKYSPKNEKIIITTKKTDHSVDIAIQDNGIGISQENIEHIFDRFYRADNARSKQKTSGYGLGLSIAKKIAENHNGSIHAASVTGKGSTFTIRLPLYFS
jgi:two-component system, OmpR family, sensor histidine kinase CiaH